MYSNILLSFYFLFLFIFFLFCHCISLVPICWVLRFYGWCAQSWNPWVYACTWTFMQHFSTVTQVPEKRKKKHTLLCFRSASYALCQNPNLWDDKSDVRLEIWNGGIKLKRNCEEAMTKQKLFSSPSSAYEYLPLGSKGYWAITIWTIWSQEFFAASKLSDRSCISWTLWYLEIYREDLATASNNCKRNSILAEEGDLLCDLVIASMLKWLTNDALHRYLLNDSSVK